MLETAAHINDQGLPLNRFLVRIDVPLPVWAAQEEKSVEALPAGWSAVPAGAASANVGSQWRSALRSAILLVPSVIVPEERVALVNPRHPDAGKMTATLVRAFEYNRLFRA